ncbi:MAG: AraC family transcriptional regulator [Pseudomonadota bacterium]
MDVLSHLLDTFRLDSRVFHNGQYCGDWQIDTSGARKVAFHVVTYGECELLLERGTSHQGTLKTGDLVVFPRDREHRIASNPNPKSQLNRSQSMSFSDGLQSSGTGLVCGHLEFEQHHNQFLIDLLPDTIVVHSHDKPWDQNLRPIVDLLIAESLQTEPGVHATLNRLTELFFVIILRQYLVNAKETKSFADAFSDTRILKVLEIVYEEPEKEWDVNSMAQIAAMSRSAFAARFKELLNESPMQHIKRWRMRNAYRWLRDERLTVNEAADRSGYNTEAAFAKAFKKEIGVSPGIVRKSKLS